MRSRVVAVLCVAGPLACGGTAEPAVSSGVRVVASPQRSDTVLALAPQALIVELRGGERQIAPGQAIRFEVLAPKGTTRTNERGVHICRVDGPSCGAALIPERVTVSDTTDKEGRARVLVRYGTITGPAWVRFAAPQSGFADSVLFTVQPGAATRIRFQNAPAAVKVGSAITVVASATDRWDNARADQPSFSTSFSNVTIDSRGRVSGLSVGRANIFASFGAYRDSSYVSVVPDGRYLFHTIEFGVARVMEIAFDGSGSRFVAEKAINAQSAPNGAVLVHQFTFGSGQRLQLVTPDVPQRRVTISDIFQREEFGQLAANGWIYFSGALAGESFSIWRIRPDGGGLERRTSGLGEWRSAPSPDGTKLLYHRTGIYRNAFDAWDLVVMDIQGGFPSLEIRDVLGAAWSPDGSQIAYLSQPTREVMVVNADGSGQRKVSNQVGYYDHLDWTTDHDLLLVRSSQGVELMRVSNGERIPLPSTGDFLAPVAVR